MARHQTVSLTGPDDQELGILRSFPLRYHLTVPATGTAAGLVYLIAGFGEDDDVGYATHLRESIADEHGLAVVSVDYHACRCRPNGGAKLEFLPIDAQWFASMLGALGVTADDDVTTTIVRMQAVLDRLPERRQLELTADLVPESGEHQNFGVVQALDHLTVHADLLRRLEFDRSLVIAFGSSHGAYIGHLMARIAPNTITAVLDNSGYAQPALPYFLGREMGARPVVIPVTTNISLVGFPRTRWTLQPGLANCYGGDAHRFRDLLDAYYVAQHARQTGRRTQFRCLHSCDDRAVAPVQDKVELIRRLRAHGFDAEITVMTAAEVDGRFVKTLEHGMNLSLKQMFRQLIGTVVRTEHTDDFTRASVIDYTGDERSYRFHFTSDRVAFSIAGRAASS